MSTVISAVSLSSLAVACTTRTAYPSCLHPSLVCTGLVSDTFLFSAWLWGVGSFFFFFFPLMFCCCPSPTPTLFDFIILLNLSPFFFYLSERALFRSPSPTHPCRPISLLGPWVPAHSPHSSEADHC